MTIRYATATRTSRMTAVNTAIGTSGKLRVYTGTQPANPQAAVTGTLLADIPLATTAGSVTSGTLNFTSVSDTSADASGVPGWATVTTSADVRIIDMSCTVGAGGDLVFSANIVATGVVTLSSLAITDGTS